MNEGFVVEEDLSLPSRHLPTLNRDETGRRRRRRVIQWSFILIGLIILIIIGIVIGIVIRSKSNKISK